VPIDLTVDVGAARADLEFGGLMLSEARIHTGAAEARVTFSRPNAMPLALLEVDAGAASVKMTGLANSNASQVKINGGVGDVSLSFDGRWTRDMNVDASMALGKLALHVPNTVGVQVDAKHFLADFDHGDLVKRGDVYVSPNWDSAPFKLRIHSATFLGSIQVDHATR
jgi:hypothetical protein